MPAELLLSLGSAPGFNREAFERVHDSGEQVVSVRLNPLKTQGKNLAIGGYDRLRLSKVPWSVNGYYLEKRPVFTLDPLIHAGAYYVQEASSMFLEEAMRQSVDLKQPIRVLDLCAAPGGKSTLIQSIISPESLLVSNETIKTRVGILEENLSKWGGANVVVTNNDPSAFSRLGNYFDLIVIDAPCSGSGLFRREPEAIGEWSKENVTTCSLRQQRILADVWPALKKNGLLIYSTCSYSMEEDEQVLDKIAGEFSADSLQIKLQDEWNIVETVSPARRRFGYRFYPDRIKGEGFFIACLRKKDGDLFSLPRSFKSAIGKINKTEAGQILPYLAKDAPVSLLRHQEQIFAMPAHLVNDLAYLQKNLYLKKSGVIMGKAAAKEFIPDHEAAMSRLLSGNIPSISLSREDSIHYLRKDEFIIDGAARGWNLVQFQDINLGWIKMLDRRFNNYYPVEWRIRMGAA